MSKIPFSISDRSLTFYVDGSPYSIDRSSPAWDELKGLVQEADPDVDRLISLTNPVKTVEAAVESVVALDYLPRGKVSVTRTAIKYDDVELDGVLVERIFDMLSEGFNIMPMVRFLENLMTNPADFARDELYLWLESSDLPITEDGHFLAYKNVRGDFKSIHDGKTDNTPGLIVSMPRSNVDADRDRTCSAGLHFCSKSYLPSFSHAADGHTVLLKINPADVVSIPSDYDNAKGRAWKYEVLKVVDFDIPTHKWASVYVTDDTDDDDTDDDEVVETMLEFPSPLAGMLFAALTDIGIDVSNSEERIDWVNDTVLLDNEIDSFKELTVHDANQLLEFALDIKDMMEDDADSAENDAENARIEAINNYGIITLRSKASKAGFPKAWKGPKASELRNFLIDNGIV